MWYGDEIQRSAYWCVDEIADMFADHPPTQRAVYEAGERIVDFIRTREQVPMIGPVSQPHLTCDIASILKNDPHNNMKK